MRGTATKVRRCLYHGNVSVSQVSTLRLLRSKSSYNVPLPLILTWTISMSIPSFRVTEHVIPCQHIREYPHAVKSEPAVLKLAIKEYRPLDNINVAPGSVTIIATHANGLPKETYEPLWDDLHRAFRGKIRAIWVADCSHQGASGVLNESIQGDDRECEWMIRFRKGPI